MNQDCKSKDALPQPGDRARVEDWPWANPEKPGTANVVMTSGACKGGSYSLGADLCEAVDESAQIGDEVIVNAGQCHGPALSHIVAAPEVKGPCHSLVLMFRAHYAERPVLLPPPVENSSTLYLLEYFPGRAFWADAVVLQSNKPLAALAMEDEDKVESLPPLFLHIEAKETTTESGQYRCYHNLSVRTDASNVGGSSPQLASVCYKMPGQGFRNPEHTIKDPPFALKLGPCWGRPHVTIDLLTTSGETCKAVFEANLPRKSAVVPLLQTAPLKMHLDE